MKKIIFMKPQTLWKELHGEIYMFLNLVFLFFLFLLNEFRIHEKYKNASDHLENQSLSLHFYDLNVPGQPNDHLLYMIFLIVSFIILGVAYKMRLIHFN